MDATFWYLGLKPVKAEVKVPDCSLFNISEVNRYLGRIAFIDPDGKFYPEGRSGTRRMYLFKFHHQKGCSDTRDSNIHQTLVKLISSAILDDSFLNENLFEKQKRSPGRDFFQIQSDVIIEHGAEKLCIEGDPLLSKKPRYCDYYRKEPENITTENMQKTFADFGKKKSCEISTGRSFCKYSPFSGGGDITVFHNIGALTLLTNSCPPNSPTTDREEDCKFAFGIENKISALDGRVLEQQLLANMMVTLSVGVVKLCRKEDDKLYNLKNISVYGLSLDRILPTQMFKLTMNFEDKTLRRLMWRRSV